MLVLGIDTSNYATSLAIYDTTAKEVVCDKKQFLPVKQGELGLRQSDAVFHHTVALPDLLRQINDSVSLTEIGAVGVSCKPRPIEAVSYTHLKDIGMQHALRGLAPNVIVCDEVGSLDDITAIEQLSLIHI